jgi:hypothetical protein
MKDSGGAAVFKIAVPLNEVTALTKSPISVSPLGSRADASLYLFMERKGLRDRWRRGGESNSRIKVLQTSPLPLGYRAGRFGAGNGIRTRDFDLGKVALYH